MLTLERYFVGNFGYWNNPVLCPTKSFSGLCTVYSCGWVDTRRKQTARGTGNRLREAAMARGLVFFHVRTGRESTVISAHAASMSGHISMDTCDGA